MLTGPRSACRDDRSAALSASAAIAAGTLPRRGGGRAEQARIVRDHAADARGAHALDARALVDRPGEQLARALPDAGAERRVDDPVVGHHGVEAPRLECAERGAAVAPAAHGDA